MKKLLVIGLAFIAFAHPSQSSQPTIITEEVERLVAPVALYPDTVLSHLLIAATEPLDLVEAQRWIEKRPHLQGEAAVRAATAHHWHPSISALTAFPDLLQRMSDHLSWTRQLGDAFEADEAKVLRAIQTLREQAYNRGHLDSGAHIKVVRQSNTIIIHPRRNHVIYLPRYDSRLLLGQHRPTHHRHAKHGPHKHGPHKKGLTWGIGVRLGSGIFNSSFNWSRHQTVTVITGRYSDGHRISRHDHARHWRWRLHGPHGKDRLTKRYPQLPEPGASSLEQRSSLKRNTKRFPKVRSHRSQRETSGWRSFDQRKARTPGRLQHRHRPASKRINFGRQSFNREFKDRLERHRRTIGDSKLHKAWRINNQEGGKINSWRHRR